MIELLKQNWETMLSLVLSVVLGFLVGWERKRRSKEAGIRTHAVVSLGSALLMIISKYGFFDVADADSARIAAQVVSGIGFIGAGMIVYRKNIVHGLTTAAGVWATAGIGMACGARMYFISVFATLLLVGVHWFFHLNIKAFKTKKSYELKIVFIENDFASDRVKELFGVEHFKKLTIENRGEMIYYTAKLCTDILLDSNQLNLIMKENEFIKFIERCDEE
jgi:putative Mg2+ transporter-C (MgtC) family protein